MIRFAVLSDIHVRKVDAESQRRLILALNDYHSMPKKPNFLVINGDLTEGFEQDYEVLVQLLNKHCTLPVFMTMGNHEYYKMWYDRTAQWSPQTFPNGWSSELALSLFLKSFCYPKPYYDIWIKNDHFIFLMGERYRDQEGGVYDHAWLSDEQFSFLKATLREQEKPHKPIFVFLHQPLSEVVQGERLAAILSQHPQVILFTGHTHHQLKSKQVFVEHAYLTVGTSSVRWPWTEDDKGIDGPICESMFAEVLSEKVVLKGRRHDLGEWVNEAVFERGYRSIC